MGEAQHITILHTSDIHAQLDIHDEFFYEEGRPAFKRRGGFATLCTMIDALRQQNPRTHSWWDGGDRFREVQSQPCEGPGHPPSSTGSDMIRPPGNWEVVYGKEMLIKDMACIPRPNIVDCGPKRRLLTASSRGIGQLQREGQHSGDDTKFHDAQGNLLMGA